MIISNGFLTYNILIVRKKNVNVSKDSESKRKSLCITVLVLTSIFVLLTLPDNIMNAFYNAASIENGYEILFFLDSLAFTYHGLQFFILIITNQRFKSEFKLMLEFSKSSAKVASASIS